MAYSDKLLAHFDKALEGASVNQFTLQQIKAKDCFEINEIKNATGDMLVFALIKDEQGNSECIYQIKAPVISIAVAAYCSAHIDMLMQLTLDRVCRDLDIPNTHRHQAQWVLDHFQNCLQDQGIKK